MTAPSIPVSSILSWLHVLGPAAGDGDLSVLEKNALQVKEETDPSIELSDVLTFASVKAKEGSGDPSRCLCRLSPTILPGNDEDRWRVTLLRHFAFCGIPRSNRNTAADATGI
jgi:hypothetical protein